MSDPNDLPQLAYQYHEAQQQQQAQYEALQQAKLKALQQALGNRGVFTHLDLNDLIDPDNKSWADYTYKFPGHSVDFTDGGEIQGRINAGTPEWIFINNIRNAEDVGAVYKQSELWDSYDPLSSHDNARKYFRYMFGGSEPESPTANGSDSAQTTAGDTAGGVQGTQAGVQGVQAGTQGTQGVQGVQGVQAGAKTGNAVAGGGVQGSNNGSGSAQGAQAGNAASGKKPRMSDDEINAFLREELGDGIYASADVAKGGTKTIGYDDPNPGNVSLAYAMRNAPEQERKAALINEWNRWHGISYATGKDGLIYRTDPQHPNGYVDPFKNDLSKTGSTGYATGKGMLTSGSNGTYATGESIKDANGNILTNPGGDWEYQYALRDPQYGLGMMGKMSDAQKEYLQAVSNNMGFNYNFTGAPRYV